MGPDGHYGYWGTVPHQGPLENVVQGTHKTLKCNVTGAPCYTDSLTFGLQQNDRATIMLAFSHSQDFIKGDFAYGDKGQNYKNLITIAEALVDIPPIAPVSKEILFGCPEPPPVPAAH